MSEQYFKIKINTYNYLKIQNKMEKDNYNHLQKQK